MLLRLLMLTGICSAFSLAAVAAEEAQSAIDFESQIRPILNANCTECHGAENQKGGLRLDHKEPALRGGDNGAVITPGDAAASKLFQLVSGADPEKVMPPKGERLSAEEVDVLRAWIASGAHWPDEAGPVTVESDHWAFQPIERPAVPEVQNTDWVSNPIDNFVLARLEEEGMEPSPRAEDVTLMRRLHFDLIGLPPTLDEQDAFLNDDDAYAYERLVNRLLASPHYGERWGRHWLDLARYADSDGYEKDTVRPYAYRYRDWVIDAINRDLPYDQFVIEQLAGDLLPNPTQDQLLATGFHRNTLTNKEGGIDPEEDRVKQAVDRTNTTASVFMGLTLACAECHTHKYDPITQTEYYEFYSFFNRAMEKDIPAPMPGEVKAYEEQKARWNQDLAAVRKSIDEYRPELAKSLPEWEANLDLPDKGWAPLDAASYLSQGGANFQKLDDGSLLLSGDSPAKDTYTIVSKVMDTDIRAVRFEALTHDSLVNGGPGRAHNGNFVLAEFTVKAAPLTDPAAAKPVKIASATVDYAQQGYEIEKVFDGNPDTGWAIYADKDFNKDRTATFVLEEPVGYPEGTLLTVELTHTYGREHNVGRFRISTTTVDPKILTIPDDVFTALKTAPAERTEAQTNLVIDYYGKHNPHMRELQAKLEGLLAAEPKAPDTKAQIMAANPEPPETRIHIRGDFLRKGEKVEPGTLDVLHAFEPRNETPNRMDLAKWIVDPDNPLTARVQVNRVWKHLFGRGIVKTMEDFGTRSEAPSHPELLDWLASEYVAQGWSTKDLIRLIVSSSTYQQASHTRPAIWEDDPENRKLASQNRFRVEAEIVRDAWLTASGLLYREIGGPSVRPQLPDGVADLGYAGSVTWAESGAPDKYRRGIYILFQRTVPYPMLMNFDCPDSNVSASNREQSNTPLQALNTLNSPVFFECAQALGKRVLEEMPGDDLARIKHMFKICLSREPQQRELETLHAFLQEQRTKFKENEEAAVRFASAAKSETSPEVEAAAYVALARVIMNLDEFITRE